MRVSCIRLRAAILTVLGALVVFTSGVAGAAAPGCQNSDPIPGAASPDSEVVAFTGNNGSTQTFNIVLWRLHCDQTYGSRLFARIAPTYRNPFICSDDFLVIQGGKQYAIHLASAWRLDSVTGSWTPDIFCDALYVPTTFALIQFSTDPNFDYEGALTLFHKGAPDTQGDLPAARHAVTPITPVAGLWYDPDQSGNGFGMDYKNGVLLVQVYSYLIDGAAQWYLSAGTINANVFRGTLDRYVGGQCVSGPACTIYNDPGPPVGSDGEIVITFTSARLANVVFPGGRRSTIQPYFGP